MIYLLEDDDSIRKLVLYGLDSQGFQAKGFALPSEFWRAMDTELPELVLLDIMLPGMDGFEVCRAIRSQYKGVILMLTARDEDLDQILGLELGADDYISKPVQPRLLLARIKALLRRTPAPSETADAPGESNEAAELSFGNFRISQATRSTHLGDETIDLTTAEFDLLWLLALHAGSILSRDDLLQQLRGIGFDGLDRSIDARISRLRRKLGDDPENPTRIKTVRGKGYLFSKHDWQ